MGKHYVPAHTEIDCDLCGRNCEPVTESKYVQFKYYKVFGKKAKRPRPKKIYICANCWRDLSDRCAYNRYEETIHKKK